MSYEAEPWSINDDYIATAECDTSIYIDEVGRDNAERIVACVNFCQGLPTELLLMRDADRDHAHINDPVNGSTIIVPVNNMQSRPHLSRRLS